MFKMFRLLFYNLGIKKLNNLNNKLEFISLSKFSPYDPLYVDIQLSVLGEGNIEEYVKTLETIIKLNPLEDKLEYVFETKLYNTSLGIWCSDNRSELLNINNIIDDFLKYSIEINKLYLSLTSNNNKFIGKYLYNAKKLYPHIINIENIISTIVNRKIKE